VDGEELVAGLESAYMGVDPSDLVASGVLLPPEVPLRAALYACPEDGTTLCVAVTALISATSEVVTWSDFREYHATFDDVVIDEADLVDRQWTSLPMPTLTFAREAYTHEVISAAAACS
jgi:hypothetical protein